MIAVRGKKGQKSNTVDRYRPIKVATLNRNLTVLNRILNVAREWKYRTQQPKIRNLSGEEGHERVINHDERMPHLAAAPELLNDFAMIALDTGLRPDSELCALRSENVHFEPAGQRGSGTSILPAERPRTQNGMYRYLPG
jgi:integrase